MRKKWVIRVAAGLLGVAALTALGVAGEWKITRVRGQARVRAAVEKLDAEEPGWRAPDFYQARNAKLPPPGRNAGAQTLAAIEGLPKSFDGWWKTGHNTPFEKPPTNHLLQPDAVATAKRVRDDCAHQLRALEKVRDLPEGGFELTLAEPNPLTTPLPKTQKLREATSLLALDAAIRAYDRRPQESLQSCRAILNVASGGVGDEPTLISQLVRVAITNTAVREVERTLAWNEVPAGLPEIQARLAAERDVPRMRYALRGERASMFHLFENLDSGALTINAIGGSPEPDSTLKQLYLLNGSKVYPKAQAYALEHFGKLIDALKLPDPGRRGVFETMANNFPRANSGPPSDRIVTMLLPATDKVNDAETLLRARISCAVAGVACERFRVKNGRWPKSLAEIPGDILAEMPGDPFTGKPLLLLTRPDGVTVYSTGLDGEDNGGLRLGTGNDPGTDIGFRLWNPEVRRAAPLPPDKFELPE